MGKIWHYILSPFGRLGASARIHEVGSQFCFVKKEGSGWSKGVGRLVGWGPGH